MKGLRKYIAPFAPDQSGAAAVLCELGGMVIILDAGGCAGNICGFDEPRWFTEKSAMFSAGLRDMDAILGRDDRLVEKIVKACRKMQCNFIAVIGTPVPSVIGTDYRALKKMIEKQTGYPAVMVETNGMELYDAGIEKALLEIFKTFTEDREGFPITGRVGILGATPLDIPAEKDGWNKNKAYGSSASDIGLPSYGDRIRQYYQKRGFKEVFCYGLGSDFPEIAEAAGCEKNFVIAPAALPAARYLKKKYGIPFETGYPLEILPGWDQLSEDLADIQNARILIVHQQMLANALREYLVQGKKHDPEIVVASWFGMDKEFMKEQDICIKEEEQWANLVRTGDFDLVIGDELFFKALPESDIRRMNLNHFAVSGHR